MLFGPNPWIPLFTWAWLLDSFLTPEAFTEFGIIIGSVGVELFEDLNNFPLNPKLSGLFLGFKLRKKALVNGLKLSSIFIALLSLLILISPLEFTINTFISYILIIILVNIGTFIGVNKKKVK